jgi:hypothetical protein
MIASAVTAPRSALVSVGTAAFAVPTDVRITLATAATAQAARVVLGIVVSLLHDRTDAGRPTVVSGHRPATTTDVKVDAKGVRVRSVWPPANRPPTAGGVSLRRAA